MKKHFRYLFAAALAVVGIVAWADVDYSVNFQDENTDHPSRYTKSVSLTVDGEEHVISPLQEGLNQALYWDMTDQVIECAPGAEIVANVGNMDWMHSYVYLDKESNGFECAEVEFEGTETAEDIKAICPDLVAYNFFSPANSANGFNSLGEAKNDGCGTKDIPAFNAPEKAGSYRVRLKIDWNCIDPKGNPGHIKDNGQFGDQITANGGIIVDVTLKVVAAEEPQEGTISGLTDINGNPVKVGEPYALAVLTADGKVFMVDASRSDAAGCRSLSKAMTDDVNELATIKVMRGGSEPESLAEGDSYEWYLETDENGELLIKSGADNYVVRLMDNQNAYGGGNVRANEPDVANATPFQYAAVNTNTYSLKFNHATHKSEGYLGVGGGNYFGISSTPQECVFVPLASEEPEAGPVTLDELTSGWYQLEDVVSEWTPTAVGEFFGAVELENAVLHNGDLYDIVKVEDKTALSSLLYFDRIDDEHVTITLPTGYRMGKGCSRSVPASGAINTVLVDAPDEDQTNLRFKNEKDNGNNYWEAFTNAGPMTLGAGANQSMTRFHLYSGANMISGKDVYTVVSGEDIAGTPTVTYNNEAYTGIKTVVAGGVFFIEKGATLTEADFTTPAATAVEIDAQAKTITVVPGVTPEDMAAAAAEAKEVIALRGVGYPRVESEAYSDLEAAIEAVEESEPDVIVLGALQDALAAYKEATDIEQPEVGKSYRLAVVSGNSATLKEKIGYLTYEEAGVKVQAGEATDDAVLKCVEEVDGKYVFQFSLSGQYLIYKNGRAADEQAKGAGENENKGYAASYESCYAAFAFAHIAKTQYAVQDDRFGIVSMTVDVHNLTVDQTAGNRGCFTFANSGAWDTANAPFFKDSHTSALAVEEVEDLVVEDPLFAMKGAAAEPNDDIKEMIGYGEVESKQMAEGEDIKIDVYEDYFIIRDFIGSKHDLKCWYSEDEDEGQTLVYKYAIVGQNLSEDEIPGNIGGSAVKIDGEYYDLQMGLCSFNKPGFLFIYASKLSDLNTLYYYSISWKKTGAPAPLYRFVSANTAYMSVQGVEKAMYSTNTGAGWTTLDETAENQVWYFAKDEEGRLYPINYATGLYIGNANTQSANVAMTATPHYIVLTELEAEGEQQYTIKVDGVGFDLHTAGHSAGAGVNGNIVGWNGSANSGSAWYVRQMTIDEVTDEMLAAAEAANDKLADAFLRSAYNALLAAAGDKIDELKATEGFTPVAGEKLVTDVEQISSPKTQAGEGSIDALIDGDKSTYWHSEWSAGSVADDNSLHYLEFDLGQAYDNLMLTYQRRQNVQNDHPTEFTIYGSNDGENFDEIKVIPVTKDGDAVVHQLFIGNETAYRYIRVRASKTDYWRGYWHAAEMNLCSCELVPGEHLFTKAGSKATDVEAVVNNPAENPTQEDIDALTEMLAALNARIDAYYSYKALIATINSNMLNTLLANDEELAALNAALDAIDEDAIESILAGLEKVELEDKAVFTLATARGDLFAAENEEGELIAVTSANKLGLTKAEGADQWSFIEYFGAHYLYNVANGLFLNPDLTLTEAPAAKENVFEVKNSSSAEYPFVIEDGENWINVSGGYEEGVVINDWTSEDAGNQFAIRRVGFHNPAAAQLALLKAFPPALGELTVTPETGAVDVIDEISVIFNDWTAVYEMSSVLRNEKGEMVTMGNIESLDVANGYKIVFDEPVTEEGKYVVTVDAFLLNENNGLARWATVDLEYSVEHWKLVTTGTYTYSKCFEGEDPGLELYKNTTDPNLYKITDWAAGGEMKFTWDEETDEVYVIDSETGYNHATYGMIMVKEVDEYRDERGADWDSEPSYYDPLTKTFHFGVAYYVPAGYFGHGYETFVLEGGGPLTLLYSAKGTVSNYAGWDADSYSPAFADNNVTVNVYEGGMVEVLGFAGVEGHRLFAIAGEKGEVASFEYTSNGYYSTGVESEPWMYPYDGEGYSYLTIGEKSGSLLCVVITQDDEENLINQMGYYYVTWQENPYATNYDNARTTRSDRCTSSVSLTNEDGDTQTIEDLQSGAVGEKIYWECVDQTFTVKAGETLYPEMGYNGQWMHGYVYVDEDGDGFSCDIDEETHGYLEGSDLKTWSYIDGYNSLGEEAAGGCNVNAMPAFQAPAKAGTYRMRFKVDWDCADPKGQKGESNNLDANGGIIVDVTLVVEGGNAGDGKLYTLRTARGYLPASDEMTDLWGNNYIVATQNVEEAGKFQLVPAEDGYYLLNTDLNAYLSADSTPDAPYVEEPDGSFNIYSATEEGGIDGAYIIKSNVTGKWLMFGGSKQFLNNDGWSTVDDGDMWYIEEVAGETEPEEEWSLFANGVYHYEQMWEGDDPQPCYKSNVEEHLYKIVDLFYGVDFTFTWNEETNECHVDKTYTGYDHAKYGSVYVMELNDYAGQDMDMASYYDPETKTFYFAVVFFCEEGYFGYGYETYELAGDDAYNGETGIKNLTVKDVKSAGTFNLQGIKVNNINKSGLYIIDGKKVVIKK